MKTPATMSDENYTKPLDHDDIVGLGWRKVRDDEDATMYHIPFPPEDHVLFWERGTDVIRMYSANGPYEFAGHLPHKQALRQVMEWVRIDAKQEPEATKDHVKFLNGKGYDGCLLQELNFGGTAILRKHEPIKIKESDDPFDGFGEWSLEWEDGEKTILVRPESFYILNNKPPKE